MVGLPPPDALYFTTRDALREWFERNHDRATEVWIGYFKRGSGRTGVTYPEVVDEALCFGWIDGRVRSIDAERYANRYTPRRPRSRWSQANVARVLALERGGRLHPAGRRAFDARDSHARAGYTFEEPPRVFRGTLRAMFAAYVPAWRFFRSQPPSYRRVTTFWVINARQQATRVRRLRALIRASRQRKGIDLLNPTQMRRAPSDRGAGPVDDIGGDPSRTVRTRTDERSARSNRPLTRDSEGKKRDGKRLAARGAAVVRRAKPVPRLR